MIRRLAVIFLSLAISGGILVISLFRNASIRYAFTAPTTSDSTQNSFKIDYNLAYPGRIAPDSPLWPIKVLRDKLWLVFAFDHAKKAEIDLLLADKRIASAIELFQKDKANLGYSTLTKSEKYLEQAQSEANLAQVHGENVDTLLQKIALSSLKHVETSGKILALAPDDAKPQIILNNKKLQGIYQFMQNSLLSRGLSAPKNPFNWN